MKKFVVTFAILLLLLLMCIQLLTRMKNASFDFDEGYNLQISLNIHNYGKYSTFDSLFDPNITTGPTVLVPASFLVNSARPYLPRLIPVIFAILLTSLVLLKVQKTQNQRFLYLLLLNIVPLYYLFGSQVLGEIPGFFFVLFSYFLLSKNRFFSAGICMSLAILTKSLYILGLIPVIYFLYYFINHSNPSFKQLTAAFLRFSVGFLAVIAIWELYRLSAFHFNFHNYVENLAQTNTVANSKVSFHPDQMYKRIDMIGYVTNIGGFFFIFLTLYIAGYLFTKKSPLIIRLITVYTVFYLLYFLILGSTNWYRHFFPVMLGLTIILPPFLSLFFEKITTEKTLTTACIVAVLALCSVNYIYRDENFLFVKLLTQQNLMFLDQTPKPYFHQKKILVDQLAAAKYISTSIPQDQKITGVDWFNAPEISYLTNRKIERHVENKEIKYIILHLYGKFLSGDMYNNVYANIPLKKLYANDSYEVYERLATTSAEVTQSL